MKNRNFVYLFMLLPLFSLAAGEKQRWYVAENGNSYVQESVYGNVFAELAKSTSGQIGVYFSYETNSCEYATEPEAFFDIEFNGQLMKIMTQCGEYGWRSFWAKTSKGNQFVVNQFKHKQSVQMVIEDKKFQFSAIGFTKLYNKFKARTNAI